MSKETELKQKDQNTPEKGQTKTPHSQQRRASDSSPTTTPKDNSRRIPKSQSFQPDSPPTTDKKRRKSIFETLGLVKDKDSENKNLNSPKTQKKPESTNFLKTTNEEERYYSVLEKIIEGKEHIGLIKTILIKITGAYTGDIQHHDQNKSYKNKATKLLEIIDRIEKNQIESDIEKMLFHSLNGNFMQAYKLIKTIKDNNNLFPEYFISLLRDQLSDEQVFLLQLPKEISLIRKISQDLTADLIENLIHNRIGQNYAEDDSAELGENGFNNHKTNLLLQIISSAQKILDETKKRKEESSISQDTNPKITTNLKPTPKPTTTSTPPDLTDENDQTPTLAASLQSDDESEDLGGIYQEDEKEEDENKSPKSQNSAPVYQQIPRSLSPTNLIPTSYFATLTSQITPPPSTSPKVKTSSRVRIDKESVEHTTS